MKQTWRTMRRRVSWTVRIRAGFKSGAFWSGAVRCATCGLFLLKRAFISPRLCTGRGCSRRWSVAMTHFWVLIAQHSCLWSLPAIAHFIASWKPVAFIEPESGTCSCPSRLTASVTSRITPAVSWFTFKKPVSVSSVFLITVWLLLSVTRVGLRLNSLLSAAHPRAF